MNIASLPSLYVRVEWESHRKVVIPSLTPVEQHGFADLKAFYDRYWLNEITPTRFSVWRVGDRTNNCVESMHRWSALRFPTNHPAIMMFTHNLDAFFTDREERLIDYLWNDLTKVIW